MGDGAIIDNPQVLLQEVVRTAKQRGASYADIRMVDQHHERIELRTGQVESIAKARSLGIGVRVLLNGSWGFSCSPLVTPEAMDRALGEALELAQAAALVRQYEVILPDIPIYQDDVTTPYEIDPFSLSLEQKIEDLMRADDRMRAIAGISLTRSFLDAFREEKLLATSEGTYVRQVRIDSGGGITATAIGGGDTQHRSYPNNHGSGGMRTAGYEFVQGLNLAGHAEETAREAVALLSAEVCPAGSYDLVLDSAQVAYQVHESCGHPAELDRVFGMEAAYAGGSFLTANERGKLRYGSPIVNLVADATQPGGLASFAYDDDAMRGTTGDIVRGGVLAGYLTSRETFARAGCPPNPSNRATSWNRIPLVRMTNVNLEAGQGSVADIIADTKRGMYMATMKSGSIDDRRLNFQFGPEIAYEILDGKLGRMLKNPIYRGVTPRFWGSCDAIAGADDWRLWGLNNCGKGEPQQIARVGHGASPARFRNVEVGGMR